MKLSIYTFCCLFILNGVLLFAEEINSQTNSQANVSPVADVSSEDDYDDEDDEEMEAAEAEEENAPIPYPQASVKPAEEKKSPHEKDKEKEVKPKKPPEKYGDCTGEFWIGQRIVTERHAGWGWLKKDGESWKSAKWIMLDEKHGSVKGPQRFYNRTEDDNNMQYRLYGDFASYKGYEPNIDSLVDVFELKGFEVIGAGPKIDRKPPGPTGSRKGRISEREAF